MEENGSARILGIGRSFRHAVSELRREGAEIVRWLFAVQDVAKAKSAQKFLFLVSLSLTAVPSSLHATDFMHVLYWSRCGGNGE